MSWRNDSSGDSMTTTGLLVVGGVLLLSHAVLPFVWWNFLGGKNQYDQRLRVPTPTPTARPAVLPLILEAEQVVPTGAPTGESVPAPTPTRNQHPVPLLPLGNQPALPLVRRPFSVPDTIQDVPYLPLLKPRT